MKNDNETAVAEQFLKPRRSKSREVSSRYLSPTSTPTHDSGNQSPSKALSPVRRKSTSIDPRKHRSLDEPGGLLRGLWPSSSPVTTSSSSSSNPKLDTLADHLGNERLKDFLERKSYESRTDNGSVSLTRQRSRTELADSSPKFSKKFTIKNAIKRANSLTGHGTSTSQWALSPGRSGSPPMTVESKVKPLSFSSLRPPNSPSRARGVEKLLNLGLMDLFKSKKSSASQVGSGDAESFHQLKLIYNRWMQWRYANAKADAVNKNINNQVESYLLSGWNSLLTLQHSVLQKKLKLQKEKLEIKMNFILQSQMKALESWAEIERQHLSAISMTKECLHSVICKVPLIEGAKVDAQSASMALRNASDFTISIKSILTNFSPATEEAVSLLSELAKVVAEEKLLLEECLELLKMIYTLEKYSDLKQQAYLDDLEAGKETVNLDKFFEDVDNVKEDMRVVEQLYKRLHDSNEETKAAHTAKAMKDLRARMDSDVEQVLKRVKLIKKKLEALEKSNAAHQKLPGCGPGSSSERTRTSVVGGLGNKLKDMMDDFQNLRAKMTAEYKETVERRYFTVTGQKSDEEMIENLIASGESETFFQKAIQEQGRGQIVDTISEIQERHDAIKEIEKNLIELHQLFLDMAVLVAAQGHQLNDIERHVAQASSFVMRGTGELEVAKEYQKSSRKWGCIAIAIAVFLVVLILFPILSSAIIKNT
ncbi:hypothetical protein CCACVL1_04972 [Corchorus capsularis]|uniref:t-SNARE coiled-coil homology domain-containing protein n=1 Tax=Corchorus capsularis TaxID=210143 RepID=A0A1R3JNE5_COCAP|nr:hypothetical protein CCACVL1_04972 [Corchorus capsularis]